MNKQINNKQYYKSEDLASMYGVNIRTIQRWAMAGKIKFKKIGDYYFFPKKDHEPK